MKDYAEMLQALADKFGTTVEHLWGVLIKQAAISATVDTVIVIALASIVVWGFGLVREKTKEPEQVEGEPIKYPEWDEEVAFFTWGAWVTATLIIGLIVINNVPDIASGFLNPEYWALMELKK